MAKVVQLRGGSTSDVNDFTGKNKEVVVDTDKHTLVVQDGDTKGGFPLAKVSDVKSTVEDGVVKQSDGSPFKKILMYDATNDKNVYLYIDDDSVVIEDA